MKSSSRNKIIVALVIAGLLLFLIGFLVGINMVLNKMADIAIRYFEYKGYDIPFTKSEINEFVFQLLNKIK